MTSFIEVTQAPRLYHFRVNPDDAAWFDLGRLIGDTCRDSFSVKLWNANTFSYEVKCRPADADRLRRDKRLLDFWCFRH